MSTYQFKIENNATQWLRPLSYVLFVLGLALVLTYLWFGLTCLALGAWLMVGFKTRKVTLDAEAKTIKKGSGTAQSFEQCDALRVVKKKVSQNVSSRSHTTTVRYDLYQAYLYADGEPVLIAENRDFNDMQAQLQPFAQEAGLEITD